MARPPIDTNVVLRYLIGRPDTLEKKFRGVFPFFSRVARGEVEATLAPLVVFQAWFVLTSYYEVPAAEAARRLGEVVSFRGIAMDDKSTVEGTLQTLEHRNLDLIDAYLLAWCAEHAVTEAWSFDRDLEKAGLTLLPVE